MKKATKITIAAATLLTTATAFGVASYADHRGGDGDCGWKRGKHHSSEMRHGGFGMGGMGGFFGRDVDRNFTADQIRTLSEAFLLMRGNENLKVGEISTLENGNYMVRIITQDDSLVKEVEVSKKTGRPAKFEKMRAEMKKQ